MELDNWWDLQIRDERDALLILRQARKAQGDSIRVICDRLQIYKKTALHWEKNPNQTRQMTQYERQWLVAYVKQGQQCKKEMIEKRRQLAQL